MSQIIKAVIACGGTGGHLFPGVAVAQRLHARGHEAMLLVSEKQVDALAMENHPDIPYEPVGSVAAPPMKSPKIVPFFFDFLRVVKQCREIVRRKEADVVLGMGGFTSLPVLVAGRKEKAQVFLHEANAIPGRANRMGQRYAGTALIGWEEARPAFEKARRVEVVGTPIRSALTTESRGSIEARQTLGLDSDVPTVLVIGGSQGARGLNDMVLGALPHLDGVEVQFIHLTGPEDESAAQSIYEKSSVVGAATAFWHDMGLAYAASDLVIARAGASTLNELAFFGLPAILVPYPHAAEQHQLRNAEIFTRAGAALLADEAEVDGAALAAMIRSLLSGKQSELKTLSAQMKSLAIPDSAERIASLLEESVLSQR